MGGAPTRFGHHEWPASSPVDRRGDYVCDVAFWESGSIEERIAGGSVGAALLESQLCFSVECSQKFRDGVED